MAKFQIQIDKAVLATDGIDVLRKNLQSYSNSLVDVLAVLEKGENASFMPTIYGKLKGINAVLLEEAAKMESLEKALQHIIANYSDAEKQNLNSPYSEELISSNTREHGVVDEDTRNFFQRFWDWVKKIFNWNEKPEEKPLEITRQQEKEHDLYMQNRIFALLDTQAYNKTTWNKASIEQRKDILTKYLADLSAIYGVTVLSSINFYLGPSSERGSYAHSQKLVSINENYLTRTDSYQIMQTVVHEMRHAYQHAAVDDPDSYEVSMETIEQWKNNFSNYISTRDGKTSYSEYVSQPVEYDAKNFAKQFTDLSGAKPTYTGSW